MGIKLKALKFVYGVLEMDLDNKPFTPYKLEEEKDPNDITFTVRITKSDEWFKDAKEVIRQPKNSTALKQLAKIGYMYVLHDEKIKEILETVVNNFRRNKRTGITPKEYNLK